VLTPLLEVRCQDPGLFNERRTVRATVGAGTAPSSTKLWPARQ
jgi:hypothetical protein